MKWWAQFFLVIAIVAMTAAVTLTVLTILAPVKCRPGERNAVVIGGAMQMGGCP